MFVQRDENGNIVSAFAMEQEFPVEETDAEDEELKTFLQRNDQ